jgi:hypothetical protein
LRETGYKVVAIVFFGEREVARFPTLEQAEWRAKEMNEWSERNPRGYVQYLVRPIEQPPRDE